MFRDLLKHFLDRLHAPRPAENASLEEAERPSTPASLPNPNSLPAGAVAYVGDAVFELYVRLHLLQHHARAGNLHRAATGLVNAPSQARLLQRLEPILTEEERAVVRRGRNTKSGQVPRSASVSEYRHATAFECLLGHLLLSGQEDRLLQLLEHVLREPLDEAGLEGMPAPRGQEPQDDAH